MYNISYITVHNISYTCHCVQYQLHMSLCTISVTSLCIISVTYVTVYNISYISVYISYTSLCTISGTQVPEDNSNFLRRPHEVNKVLKSNYNINQVCHCVDSFQQNHQEEDKPRVQYHWQ